MRTDHIEIYLTCRDEAPPEPVITEAKFLHAGHNADRNWQVIFKTFSGLDYCRETKTGSLPLPYIKAWATLQCYANNLAGAEIQRW